MKIFRKSVASLLLLAQGLSFAGTPVTKGQISQHLDARLSEFRNFYAEEQLWIKTKLIPLATALIEGNKHLNEVALELSNWGSLSEIRKTLDPLIGIRAKNLIQELKWEHSVLFLSDITLRRASEKHASYLKDIFIFSGQVGRRYHDTLTQLQLIDSLYQHAEVEPWGFDRIQEVSKQIEAVQVEDHKHDSAIFAATVKSIKYLLDEATKRNSRRLWLSSLSQFQRLTSDPDLAKLNPETLWAVNQEILAQEVTLESSKNDLLSRIEKLESIDETLSPHVIDFFANFIMDPAPTARNLLRAEELVLALEINDIRKQHSLLQVPQQFLISTRSKTEKSISNSAPDTKNMKPGETRTRTKITIERGNGKSKQDKITIERFSTNWAGKSDYKSTSISGPGLREKIEKLAGAMKGNPDVKTDSKGNISFDRTESTRSPDYSDSSISAEFGRPRMTDPNSSIPSTTPKENTSTTVRETETETAHVREVSIGEPVTPDSVRQQRKEIYSNNSRDRADSHNGSQDFSNKTQKIDSTLSRKASDVAREIRVGEFALQTAFHGVMEKLKNDLRGNSPLLEAANASGYSQDTSTIQNNIENTRKVVDYLEKSLAKNQLTNASEIQNGLSVAKNLIDAAQNALQSGDTNAANSLLEAAQKVLSEYGPAALRLGIGFTPAGDVADLVELISGKDAVTGEDIGNAGRVLAGLSLIVGSRTLWDNISNQLKGPFKEIKEQLKSITKVETFDALKRGPMSDIILDDLGTTATSTFRSGKYKMITSNQPTKVYRSIGPSGNPRGRFWTREIPAGPTASIIDNALPGARNPATKVIEAEIPAGTRFAEGIAGPQGHLPGGKPQIVVENPDVLLNLKEYGQK